jgi:hypothetical protein
MVKSSPHIPALKGALHTHTTCSDGDLSPEKVLAVYRDLCFDFVALTDHDFLLNPNAYQDIPDEFDGMLVFKGIEKTIFARGYFHVNQIHGDREVIHIFNHPADYHLSLGRLMERINEVQGIMPIHAVEVTANGYYTPEYDIDEIPYPKVASDDSHTAEGCGRAWIEVTCARERDAIIRSIKSGSARIRCKGMACQPAWTTKEEAVGE